MRDKLKDLLRPIHDSLFERWVYETPDGPLKGLKRRGRPPWLKRSDYDPRLDRELAFLQSLSLSGGVVYDVGANLGAHGLLLQRLVGDSGEVHLFEPDPFYRRALVDLLLLNQLGNVEVHGVALGERPSTETLLVPDDPRVRMAGTISSELKAQLEHQRTRRSVRIRVATLDGFREALGLPAPSFVKIDVEGFERQVLAGAQKTLETARPTLMIEIHGATPSSKIATTRAILAQLAPLGYRVRHLEEDVELEAEAGELPVGGHLIAKSS